MLKQVQPKPLNTRGYLNPQEEIQSPKKTKQKQKNKKTKKKQKKKKEEEEEEEEEKTSM